MRMMEAKYIVVDVESSGPTPARYSMLSFGTCLVDDPNKTFYAELKPILSRYIKPAMKVGCLGLKCLGRRKGDKQYDPKSAFFRPSVVLELLKKEGIHPRVAMLQFRNWIMKHMKHSNQFSPILASDCDAFDGMWIHYYFDRFGIQNPFDHGGVNINSMYKGFVKDASAKIKYSEFWCAELPHNALGDAIIQAKAFSAMLKSMKSGKKE